MCGGLAFKLSGIPKSELDSSFSLKKIEKFNQTGIGSSFFWDKNPVLPVILEKQTHLIEWGNKSDKIKLPKTGWAKLESLEAGKWDHLEPILVDIPTLKGYEKGIWVEFHNQKIKGVLVNKNNFSRIYMLTKPADQNYLKLTKHHRQPVENI